MKSSKRRSALDVLTPAEKASVLDKILAARPSLRPLAEQEAAALLDEDDALAVADSVAGDLRMLTADEVWAHAGEDVFGHYVDEGEAAGELLREALRPYVDDVSRLMETGNDVAARQVCLGTVLGLYSCRDDDDPGTALGRLPASDFAVEEATTVVTLLRDAGGDLPMELLAEHVPDWLYRFTTSGQ